MHVAVTYEIEIKLIHYVDLFQVLAKLAAGIHKPNGQTVLPQSSVSELFARTPIKKV